MTSRISFSKLRKEDMKRYLSMKLLIILYFMVVSVVFVLSLQNSMAQLPYDKKEVGTTIKLMIYPNNASIVFTALLAIIVGVRAFAYLHSRKQLDLYHALPVERKQIFQVITVNCILIFSVIQAIAFVLQLILAGILAYWSGDFIIGAALSLVCYVLTFTASFLLTALAMIMTGTRLAGVLNAWVLFSWIPVTIRELIIFLSSTFFKTYVEEPRWVDWLIYGSPSWTASYLSWDVNQGWPVANKIIPLIILCIWIIALFVIDQKLLDIRPSEAAGKSMAFPKWNTLIKAILLIPLSIYTGIYLFALTMSMDKIWIWIGTILGAVIFHAVIEIIYQQDVRAVFSHKKQMGIFLIASLVFVGSFAMDFYRFDQYCPKKDKVEGLRIDNGYEDYSYLNNSLIPENKMDTMKKGKGITGADKDKIISIVKKNLNHTPEEYNMIKVTYYMKSGARKTRMYGISDENYNQLQSILYASSEYAEMAYPIYQMDWNDIAEVNCLSNNGYSYWKMLHFKSTKEKEQFLSIYTEELKTLTYDQVQNVVPVGQLTFNFVNGSASQAFQDTNEYYIYPSFKKTIAFIEKNGGKLDASLADYPIAEIEIRITSTPEGEKEQMKKITDPKLIEAVKDKLYSSNSMPNDYTYLVDEMSDCEISVKGKKAEEEIDVLTDKETIKKLWE